LELLAFSFSFLEIINKRLGSSHFYYLRHQVGFYLIFQLLPNTNVELVVGCWINVYSWGMFAGPFMSPCHGDEAKGMSVCLVTGQLSQVQLTIIPTLPSISTAPLLRSVTRTAQSERDGSSRPWYPAAQALGRP
jgi:hypothetical protein